MERMGIIWAPVCAALAAGAMPAHAGYIDHYATSDDIGPDKAPAHGVSAVLVIPVIVNDVGLPTEEELLAQMEPFYDNIASGYTFGNYYRLASLDRYSPLVTVAPPVRFDDCPFSSSGPCSIPRGDPQALIPALKAIKNILDAADASVNFADFDLNGATPGVPDGYIDGLMIVSNIDFGGIALPHRRLCENSLLSYLCLLNGLGTWNETYDGVVVPWAAISGARYGWTDRAVYVSIHEFGHLLGWADLYDESGNTTDLPYSVMGGWRYDDNPHLPDAFSRYVIGWSNPVQMAGNGTATIRPAHTYGDVVKLGSGTEYFLVENRRALDMWDGDIEAGLVVQHVKLDERPGAGSQSYIDTIASCVNCEKWSPMLMVEQADGLYELQAGTQNRDDAGDMFRSGDTFPGASSHLPLSGATLAFDSNRYDGSSTGVSITAVDTDSLGDVATITVVHPALANPCADLFCPPSLSCEGGVCVEPSGGMDGGASDGGSGGEDGGPVSGDAVSAGGDERVGGDTASAPTGGDFATSPAPTSSGTGGSPDSGCAQLPVAGWPLALGVVFWVMRRRRVG